jgi:hypothetical protein
VTDARVELVVAADGSAPLDQALVQALTARLGRPVAVTLRVVPEQRCACPGVRPGPTIADRSDRARRPR